MIVVDVETSGTDPSKHSILSIGAIDLDFPDNRFYAECQLWDGAHVEPEALAVNGYSMEAISDPQKPEEGRVVADFLTWIEGQSSMLIAAQNPIFDLSFIQAAARRAHLDFNLARRTIDLHSIAFAHMLKRNLIPPSKHKKSDVNSDGIMHYVGIPAEPKPHIAINGAVWEAEALSRLLFDQTLLSQFADFPIPWK